MLTAAENDVLTRVGPGTRMGALQRRYWQPIAAVEEMQHPSSGSGPLKRVRLLGEDLFLSRDRSGSFELTAFGATAGYPVQALGGVLFAYLGPAPVPLLPQLDGFVTDGPAIRQLGRAVIPCNWLQIMENSVDPVHAEWLHGHLNEFVEEQRGRTYQHSRKHLKIAFDEFEYGIYKRRLLAGASEDSDDWRIGHPVFFPNMLAIGSGGGRLWTSYAYQMRVPIDDEHTLHLWYTSYVPPAGVEIPPHLLARVPVYDVPYRDADGEFRLDVVDSQDIMAWITQGPIAQRQLEKLGTTDRGITLYRKMLARELAKVEAGEDPMCVIRDPAKVRISFRLERDKAHWTDGFERLMRRIHVRFSPFAEDLVGVFAARDAAAKHSA